MLPTRAGDGPWPLLAVLVVAATAYAIAVVVLHRHDDQWPAWRTACWTAGLGSAAAAVTGPIAAAHHDFTAHMTGHLLLGMTAPLLLVAGAPVTLALRALPTAYARRTSRILRSGPVRVLSHPVTAAALNAGGLWLLYRTGLYQRMGTHAGLHAAVHLHVLVAGYLFTAAVVGVDPAPHRPGRPARALVLVAFLAAHGVLAKYVYGHPPAGVPAGQAMAGAQLMYYGGGLVDLVLVVVFCHQWYVAADPARPAGTKRWAVIPPRRGRWRLPADL
jgi:putative membrane protein